MCFIHYASIYCGYWESSIDCNRTAGRLHDVARLVDALQEAIETVASAEVFESADTTLNANHMRDTLLPAMLVARTISDQLETLVAEDLWPLPSYTDMLFIR